MASEWKSVCQDLSVPPQAEKDWWDILSRRYNEEWRSYHTLSHINHLLELFGQWRVRIADLDSVRLAIFFHDLVYDPTAKDNEIKSIVLFKKFAKDGKLSEEIVRRVSEMIEATITHTASDKDDLDLCLFLDFDMAILGQEKTGYDEYALKIRKEYCHYDDDAYRKGRAKVLETFLQTDHIYLTEDLREVYESRARENVQREIHQLLESK